MAIRNWWASFTADNSRGGTTVATGPQSRDGGMYGEIKARHAGSPVPAVNVAMIPRSDGSLLMRVTIAPELREMVKGGAAIHIESYPDGGFEIVTQRD